MEEGGMMGMGVGCIKIVIFFWGAGGGGSSAWPLSLSLFSIVITLYGIYKVYRGWEANSLFFFRGLRKKEIKKYI